MLEQQANALEFAAFYTESKLGKTGLTVTADVYEGASIIVTGASATEIGGGLYKYSLASGSVDANAHYYAVFKTSTTTVDQQWIPALWIIGRTWVNNADAATTTRAPASTALSNVQWTSARAALLDNLDTLLSTLQSTILAAITALASAAAIALAVWANPVRTLTSRAPSQDEDDDPELITFPRGDSYSKSWTDLGITTAATKYWLTVKDNEGQPDDDAVLQTVVGSGFATTGLIYLNGESTTTTWASLTIDDAATGDITWALDENASSQIAPGRYWFDIQVLVGSTLTTLLKGILVVTPDYTRAIN